MHHQNLRILAAVLAGVASISTLHSEGEPVRIERLDKQLDQVLAPDARVSVVVDGIEWAEGPLWDARRGALLYSDVPRNAIYRWMPGRAAEIEMERSGYSGDAAFRGREPGSNGLAFDAEGRLVFCRHGDRSIARREADGRVTMLVDRYRGKRLNSPNDLAFGANGNLYFTDPPFGLPATYDDPAKELGIQGVFRLAPNGSLTALVTDLEAPNGLGFSPDGRRLYVSNALVANPVWMVYPVHDDGSIGAGRVFADARSYVAPGDGLPDGLKTDVRGNVFAAGPGGVHIFSPEGKRLGRIITGVPTGNVAWGEDGRTLFIAANHRILRLRTLTGRR